MFTFIYLSENNSYPTATTCQADLPVEYINPYPSDPKDPIYTYCYQQLSSLTYELCAHLENGDSNDYCGGSTNCTGNCNYRTFKGNKGIRERVNLLTQSPIKPPIQTG